MINGTGANLLIYQGIIISKNGQHASQGARFMELHLTPSQSFTQVVDCFAGWRWWVEWLLSFLADTLL